MVMVLSVAIWTHAFMLMRESLVWANAPMGPMAVPITNEKLKPEPAAKN
jgi:hypothetical protein